MLLRRPRVGFESHPRNLKSNGRGGIPSPPGASAPSSEAGRPRCRSAFHPPDALRYARAVSRAMLLRRPRVCFESHPRNLKSNGRGGIRTHGTLTRTPVFKTGALNRSATLPNYASPIKRGTPQVSRPTDPAVPCILNYIKSALANRVAVLFRTGQPPAGTGSGSRSFSEGTNDLE